MRRPIYLGLAAIALVGSLGWSAAAQRGVGKPFEALWAAIAQLQRQVAAIQPILGPPGPLETATRSRPAGCATT
jgi:hypothetical protein